MLHANGSEEIIRKIRSSIEMGKIKGRGYGIKSEKKTRKIKKRMWSCRETQRKSNSKRFHYNPFFRSTKNSEKHNFS